MENSDMEIEADLALGFVQPSFVLDDEDRAKARVYDCAWHPHKDVLACALSFGRVQLFTYGSFGSDCQRQIKATETVQLDTSSMLCLGWDVTGGRLAVGNSNGAVFIWSEKDSDAVLLEGHVCRVDAVSWNVYGSPNLLISYSNDGRVVVWDASSSEEIQNLRLYQGGIGSVQWISRFNFISCSLDGRALVWRVGRERHLKEIQCGSRTSCVSVRSNVMPSMSGELRFFSSMRGGYRVHRLRCNYGQIDVCFSDGKTSVAEQVIASASGCFIKLWNVQKKSFDKTLRAPHLVQSMSFSPDGSFLAANSGTNFIIWSTRTWEEVNTFTFARHYTIGRFAWNYRNNKLAACLGHESCESAVPFIHIVDVDAA